MPATGLPAVPVSPFDVGPASPYYHFGHAPSPAVYQTPINTMPFGLIPRNASNSLLNFLSGQNMPLPYGPARGPRTCWPDDARPLTRPSMVGRGVDRSPGIGTPLLEKDRPFPPMPTAPSATSLYQLAPIVEPPPVAAAPMAGLSNAAAAAAATDGAGGSVGRAASMSTLDSLAGAGTVSTRATVAGPSFLHSCGGLTAPASRAPACPQRGRSA